ncbi:DNAJB8 [Symbiodinium natans]|uniref:DNAJB8 protein n=1 Tax=Symbiodinium natans TaxID=878477 RepID=A0A812K3U0_9DINO|nr:DNAJB8 [Symbiodinium natans]
MQNGDHAEDDVGGRPSGYVPSGATGTTAVREQLAAVKKELDFISQQLRGPGGQVQRIDLQEVERLVKHLEVDRGELAKRCQRLAEENQDLMEANRHLEVDLSAARRELDDVRRQLRHQQIDIQLKGTSERQDAESEQPSAEERLTQESLEALQAAMAASPGPSRQMSRSELIRALRATQEELAIQRARNQKLEQRRIRDSQRCEMLADAAERQRMEITAMRLGKQRKLATHPQMVHKPKMLHNLAHTMPVSREVKPWVGGEASGISRSNSEFARLPRMKGRDIPL